MSTNNRNSRVAAADALDALDNALVALLKFPLHALTRSELVELLDRLEALDRTLKALQQRLTGKLVAESARRGAGPPADLLSKRLRISRAEAQRRIADASRTAS